MIAIIIFLATICIGTSPASSTAIHALNPPTFNLAEGRKIYASATCGIPNPEEYCKLVGANWHENIHKHLVEGHACSYCDQGNQSLRHDPEFAIDGTERWWQSPPLSRGRNYSEVTLTIDLGQEFHVAYVLIKMGNSPRPGVWVLERSVDYGRTFMPWQFFASSREECQLWFPQAEPYITKDDSIICETGFSDIIPLESGEIAVRLLRGRPNSENFDNSPVLQEFTKATNVSLRLLKPKTTLGHLISVERQDPTVTRRYFYSIKDINIGGRCVCNGHASNCGYNTENPSKLVCDCRHNTCGDQCEVCCPGFVQKKWQPAITSNNNTCEPCNCNGHSEQCYYDEEVDRKKLSVDIHGRHEGGGVCMQCEHNTVGVNCEKCRPGFYRPFNRPLNATDVCVPCRCDPRFSTGSCAEGDGRCQCKEQFQEPNCDKCSYGYTGWPDCRPCLCFPNGTYEEVCDPGTGACPCTSAFSGLDCRQCASRHYGFPDCRQCDCNPEGLLNDVCDVKTGQCQCKSGYGGRACDQCAVGYHNYPQCQYCNCDPTGTTDEICNKQTGECICKEGYSGSRCDRCAQTFFGFPNCTSCNCSSIGSSSLVCRQDTGKCSCLNNYGGIQCNDCSAGYYQYPECKSCQCDAAGSYGSSCDLYGNCVCKENFAGEKCTKCKEGFYNYPICEECNCDPAGVAIRFEGCGSVAAGELCRCKEKVTGRICNHCKEGYWNLQKYNPDGCENCRCNRTGTISAVDLCEGRSGQCACKANVRGRQCDQCKGGKFGLRDGYLFGCSDCDCDVGGAISHLCDKNHGKCPCRPRIEGRRCDRPLKGHFYPTLHQYKYEIEDGKTVTGSNARFGYEDDLFPDYSWKGYAIFGDQQQEVIMDITIVRPSFYKTIFRYVNKGEAAVSSLTMTADGHQEKEQVIQLIFEPSNSPRLALPANRVGQTPTLYLSNGKYKATLKVPKALYVDYMVLLPEDYYDPTLLKENVAYPCRDNQDSNSLCRHFSYPKLSSSYPVARGKDGYTESANRIDTKTYEDNDLIKRLDGWMEGQMADIHRDQPKILLDFDVRAAGKYVLVALYHNPADEYDQERPYGLPVKARVEISGNERSGDVTMTDCPYSFICRQVVTKSDGRIMVFDFEGNRVTASFEATSIGENVTLGLDSLVAVPFEDWTLDLVTPEFVCVLKDAECLPSSYSQPRSEVIKIEFERDQTERVTGLPQLDVGALRHSQPRFVFVNGSASTEIRGIVGRPALYKIIIQYNQFKHPNLELGSVVQNDRQQYSAKASTKYCPNPNGCRTLIRQRDNNLTVFDINNSFLITFGAPQDKSILLDYVMLIPAEDFTEDLLQLQPQSKAMDFIKECAQNSFHVTNSSSDFCKKSVFSLTTAYNGQALECKCDRRGSTSYECDAFGGQCPCKPHVIGRTCTACRMGYYGFPDCKPCNCPATAYCEPRTGKCICPPRVTGDNCTECMPLTFGYDPINGCQECNCNNKGVELRRDQFNRRVADLTCDESTGQCNCKTNVIGRTCDRCQRGFWAFPECKLCDCDPRGVKEDICSERSSQCDCKEHVTGPGCDQCVDGAFHLEEQNPSGCTKCFCFGATDRCRSSDMSVIQISSMNNVNDWVIYELEDEEYSVQKRRVDESEATLEQAPGRITARIRNPAAGKQLLIGLPKEYLGNKIHSYGGSLKFKVENILRDRSVSYQATKKAFDVIFIGANKTIVAEHFEQLPEPNQAFQFDVPILERNFFHPATRHTVTREQFMFTLVTLEAILIRVTYFKPSVEVRLIDVQLDSAVDRKVADTALALRVEQCICPRNYKGSSCEECNDGYYRVQSGPYLGYCVPCQCNGHSEECDKETGQCFNCKHNTFGDHCEFCDSGYYGDSTRGTPYDCMICPCPRPDITNNFATSCQVAPDGRPSCTCKEGYEEPLCDFCSPGHFGNPLQTGDYCKKCDCNGNIDPTNSNACDHRSGICMECINNATGDECERCAVDFYGDALIKKDCKECSCDKCGRQECDHRTGHCNCKPNVIGEICDRCAPDHYNFTSCRGCTPCNCGEASITTQCDLFTGQCPCMHGVYGRTCDRCEPGYWKYGPTGCTSCNCGEKFSYGAVCNQETGQCQCLPGVLGEKCDSCPWRWVFIEKTGCRQCDQCTHFLLDDTDDLARLIDPYTEELQEASKSVFAIRRLNHVNQTAQNYNKKIQQMTNEPNKLDIVGRQDIIKQAEANLTKLEQDINEIGRIAELKVKDTHNLRIDLLKATDEFKEQNRTVALLVDDWKRFEASLGNLHIANMDSKLRDSEEMMDYLSQRSFASQRLDNQVELDNSKGLINRILEERSQPAQIAKKLEKTAAQAANLRNLLLELESTSRNATSISVIAEQAGLQINNTQETLREVIVLISQEEEEARKRNDESREKNDLSLSILSGYESSIHDITLNLKKLEPSKQRISQRLTEPFATPEEFRITLRDMNNHAYRLGEQAKDLERIIRTTRYSPEILRATNAATSYTVIVDAINNATETSNKAAEAAQEASQLGEAHGPTITASKTKSIDLLREASELNDLMERELRIPATNAVLLVDSLERTIEQSKKHAKEVDDEMQTLSQRQTASTAALNSLISSAGQIIGRANDVQTKVEALEEQIEETRTQVDNLTDTISAASKAILDGNSFAEKIGSHDGTSKRIELDDTKQKRQTEDMERFKKQVEDLKKRVALAFGHANRIELGVKILPGSWFELRNPDNLFTSGSYSKFSFSFKASSLNAFLAYVGNPLGTTNRRRRRQNDGEYTEESEATLFDGSADFMAVELRSARVLLTYDLGSKIEKLENEMLIEPEVWYNVIIERYGKTISLIVANERHKEKADGLIGGTHSVFNLIPDRAKIFIGGIPRRVIVQNEVYHKQFEGYIANVMYGDTPLGVYNFESGEYKGNLTGCLPPVPSGVEVPTGLRFDGNSYLILARNPARHDFSRETFIKLCFKTFSSEGLLFLIGNNFNDYLAVYLRDGRINLVFDLGSGYTVLQSPAGQNLNDGIWHTVDVARAEREAILHVDSKEVDNATAIGQNGELETTDNIYIGGYPGVHSYNPDEVTNVGFEGCIKDVQLDSVKIDLNNNKEASPKVIKGCPESISREASFSNASKGYIEMPLKTDINSYAVISLKYRSTQPNGLLFYTSNPDHSSFLAIFLREGSLIVRAEPGNAQISTNKRYFADGWHYITVTKDQAKLLIEVDDADTESIESGSVSLTIHAEAEPRFTYFGGVPADQKSFLTQVSIPTEFEGCLGDVTINERFQNFVVSQNRPGASLASCPLGDVVAVEEDVTAAPGGPTSSVTGSPNETYVSTGPTVTTQSPFGCVLPLVPAIDSEARLEDGLRFGKTRDSRQEYMASSTLTSSLLDESSFEIEFKTTGSEGLILYVGGSKHIDFIALYLNDSSLIFSYNCGGGTAIVKTDNNYSDDRWHKVLIHRKMRAGYIRVDDTETIHGHSPGVESSLNVKSPVFVGGLSEEASRGAKNNLRGVVSSFPGCLRNLNINNAQEPPESISLGTSKCSSKTEEGSFFFSNGFVNLRDKFRVGDRISIDVDIKPRNISGIILAVHGKKDFLVIQLIDGQVKLSVDNGAGPFTATWTPEANSFLCDGQWHHITAVKNKNLLTLVVDNANPEVTFGIGGVSSTDTLDPLYIGGVPEEDRTKVGIETSDNFVGCMKGLVISSTAYSFMSAANVYGDVNLSACPTI